MAVNISHLTEVLNGTRLLQWYTLQPQTLSPTMRADQCIATLKAATGHIGQSCLYFESAHYNSIVVSGSGVCRPMKGCSHPLTIIVSVFVSTIVPTHHSLWFVAYTYVLSHLSSVSVSIIVPVHYRPLFISYLQICECMFAHNRVPTHH